MTPEEAAERLMQQDAERRQNMVDQQAAAKAAAQRKDRIEDLDYGRRPAETRSQASRAMERAAGSLAYAGTIGAVSTAGKGLGRATHAALRGHLLDASLTLVGTSLGVVGKVGLGLGGAALVGTAVLSAETAKGLRSEWQKRRSALGLDAVQRRHGHVDTRPLKVGRVDARSFSMGDLFGAGKPSGTRMRVSDWGTARTHADKDRIIAGVLDHAAASGWTAVKLDSRDPALARALSMQGAVRQPPIRVDGAKLSPQDLDQVSSVLLQRQVTRDKEAAAEAHRARMIEMDEVIKRTPGVGLGMRPGREQWMVSGEGREGLMALGQADKARARELHRKWVRADPELNKASLNSWVEATQRRTRREITEEVARGVRQPDADKLADVAKAQAALQAQSRSGAYNEGWLPSHLNGCIKATKFAPNHGTALIKLRDGTTILDTGSDIRVKSGHITTETVGVMAAACASRGFKSVDLSGDVQFKNAMAIELAMREPPIAVNNFKMSDLARRTLDERKIERAEKRAKDKPQDVDDYFRRIVASGRPIADLPDAAQIEVRRRHRAFLSANEATADDVPVELYMQGAKVAQDRVEAQNAPRQTTMAPANDETVDNNVGNRRAKR